MHFLQGLLTTKLWWSPALKIYLDQIDFYGIITLIPRSPTPAPPYKDFIRQIAQKFSDV